jgi:hypothetical protein
VAQKKRQGEPNEGALSCINARWHRRFKAIECQMGATAAMIDAGYSARSAAQKKMGRPQKHADPRFRRLADRSPASLPPMHKRQAINVEGNG